MEPFITAFCGVFFLCCLAVCAGYSWGWTRARDALESDARQRIASAEDQVHQRHQDVLHLRKLLGQIEVGSQLIKDALAWQYPPKS